MYTVQVCDCINKHDKCNRQVSEIILLVDKNIIKLKGNNFHSGLLELNLSLKNI